MTNEEMQNKLKALRDNLNELEKSVDTKENIIETKKGRLFISSEELNKLLKPKLDKLVAEYKKMKKK